MSELCYVSFALILDLKGEPYFEIIIVRVLFGCRDSQVGPAH
jgi:hypothetical protein